MKNTFTFAAAASFLIASASASAWWNGPVGDFADEFFGNGDAFFDFNMSASGNANGYAKGYGYERAYHGPYAYAPYAYGYPNAPMSGQQATPPAK